jgi:hypothetical protein
MANSLIGILGQHEGAEPDVAPYFGKVAVNAGRLGVGCDDVGAERDDATAQLTPPATPDS